MNSKKKSFLTAASIITIVASVLAILVSCLFFGVSSIINEEFVIDIYEKEPGFTYTELVDGSYVITYTDDEEVITIAEEDIEMVVQLVDVTAKVMGSVIISMSIAKLVMSILLIISTYKNKYAKGKVITLLTLSALSFAVIEAAFLIVAMCISDKNKAEQNAEQITLDV